MARSISMICDQWATVLEQISLPDVLGSSIANKWVAITSFMCTNPTAVFGYSPFMPVKRYVTLNLKSESCRSFKRIETMQNLSMHYSRKFKILNKRLATRCLIIIYDIASLSYSVEREVKMHRNDFLIYGPVIFFYGNSSI